MGHAGVDDSHNITGDRLSADQLSRLLYESELGIVTTEVDGTIIAVSPAITEITGYSEKELLGRTPSLFKSGQTAAPTYQELWRTIRSGHTWKGALLNRRKDGRLFLDRETIVSSLTPKGNKTCFVALHQSANVEMDLRIKLAGVSQKLELQLEDVNATKSQLDLMVNMSTKQAQGISNALIASLEARDPNTAGHGMRTSMLMDLVGEQLGLFDRFPREVIRLGAILHDIGKIGLPDHILLKPGKLTDEEFEVVKTHPAVGFDILQHVATHDEVLRIVRHHHERLDGSGYPDRLRGDEIPDYVKAFAVCDCFDAMTSLRPYRPAMSAEHAISILTDDALGGRLDMSTVKVLKKLSASRALDDVLSIRAAA